MECVFVCIRENERGERERSLHGILARTSGNFTNVRKRENIHEQFVKRFGRIQLLPYTTAMTKLFEIFALLILIYRGQSLRVLNLLSMFMMIHNYQ